MSSAAYFNKLRCCLNYFSYYEQQQIGSFMLYRNKQYGIEVTIT